MTPWEFAEFCQKENLKFDIITFFEVLEHQDKPREFLEAVKSMLKPGGWIVGRVPNRDGRILKIIMRFFTKDQPLHNFLRFSNTGLSNLFHTVGFYSNHIIVIPKKLFACHSIRFLEPFDSMSIMLNEMMPKDMVVTLMLRRSVFPKIDGFIQKLKNIMAFDFPTFLRFGKVGKFYNENYIVGFWRRYSASVSTGNEEMQSKAKREAIEDFLKEQGIPHELNECNSYMQNFRMTIIKIIDGDYAEAKECLKNLLKCMKQKRVQDSFMKVKIAILKLAISLRARHILKLAYDIKYRLQYETLGKYKKKFICDPIYSKVYRLEP